MAQLPPEMKKMTGAPGIREQTRQAVEALAKVLNDTGNATSESAVGRAYRICDTWQRRFELALRSEIPEWGSFAGFRCITDFNIPGDRLQQLFPRWPPGGISSEDYPRTINTFEETWRAYMQYFGKDGRPPRELYAGKLNLGLKSEAEQHFLSKLSQCEPVLGGQAGNILWLWHCIGADCLTYVPYCSPYLAKLPDKVRRLAGLKLMVFGKDGITIKRLQELGKNPGVYRTDDEPSNAPSRGSVVVAEGGRRLIYQFLGERDLSPGASAPSWSDVQFFIGDMQLARKPVKRENPEDATWPTLPFFCNCYIDRSTLVVRLARGEDIEKAFRGRVDFAIIGGIDAVFYDPWINNDQELQGRLLSVVQSQLKTLASCGVRIGLELSGIPSSEYARFVQQLCREGIVVALGINGVDELPDIVGRNSLDNKLYEFWLDPQTVHPNLVAEVNRPKEQGESFEYVTYLRAQKLAEATGVRTLYVHTNSLDYILMKSATPGAVLRAQMGDMMGKGLVITALMQRAYGEEWLNEMEKMPLAVKPDAMAKLGRFVNDFEKYKGLSGISDRFLQSGYWLSQSSNEHCVGLVPVMWPTLSFKKGTEGALPKRLNTTGAGDMTFGAFFFLGGA